MKYGAMRVFSVLYTIFALAALLLAIELVLTAIFIFYLTFLF